MNYSQSHDDCLNSKSTTNSDGLSSSDGYTSDTNDYATIQGSEYASEGEMFALANRPLGWNHSASHSNHSIESYINEEEPHKLAFMPSAKSPIVGRKLSLPREAALLEANCQFVKKAIMDSPIYKDPNHTPAYLNNTKLQFEHLEDDNNRLSSRLLNTDPRINNMLSVKHVKLRRALFKWDENSKCLPPHSKEILIKDLTLNYNSKTYILRILEACIGKDLVEQISDVELSLQNCLLHLRESNPTKAVALLRSLRNTPKLFGDSNISVSFDPGGRAFKSAVKIAKSSTDASTLDSKSSTNMVRLGPHKFNKSLPNPPPTLHKNLPYGRHLSCSRRIPCLVIDYSVISSDESRSTLHEIFSQCRIYNIERASTAWHVHLNSQDEVKFAQRWREDFCHKGQKIEFSLEYSNHPSLVLAPEPPRSIKSIEDRTIPSQNLSYNFDELLLPTGLSTTDTTSTIEASTDLAIFNRRYLERKKIEAEAANPTIEDTLLNIEKPKKDAKVTKERKKSIKKQPSTLPSNKETLPKANNMLQIHKTGSARTEGYYPQMPNEKTIYIEDVSTVTGPAFDPRIAQGVIGGVSGSSLGSTRRLNQVQHRRWQTVLEAPGSESRSALAARRKRLVLGRSSIHSWGLFPNEDIENGSMVIEYVGEIIRYSVANVREKKYELQLKAKGSEEIASSYFFRLDGELVVDATHKGNLSRFINHSCDPTCVARIMTIDGAKRIIFYARRDIRRGEEITYDYKFPRENDPRKKIKCFCGTRNCRRFLN